MQINKSADLQESKQHADAGWAMTSFLPLKQVHVHGACAHET